MPSRPALADETEHALRLELERLNAAVLAFAHPLGVARNLAPLEALHAAQRALKGQQARDRDEMACAQQEIADRDRALAALDPAALPEARRRIEELTRALGAATRTIARHERLVYELAAFVSRSYTGYQKAEGPDPDPDPDPEDS